MKRYYQISILGRALEPLTYSYNAPLEKHFLVKVPLGRKDAVGIIVKECEKPDFKCKDLLSVSSSFISENYFNIAKFIANYYMDFLGKTLNLFTPSYSANPLKSISIATEVELSPKQQEALEFLKEKKKALLFGDTGSGKTEIYIKAIEEVLNNNQTAIFLMPEISLTPQIEKRLKEHFGDLLAIWHSKVTKTKKEKILGALEGGEIRVVAGARSSLFLPMKDLGLIIVDEEHDDSFKSEQSPRYNARDLAIYFGEKLGINVILGSATPSMTSFVKFPYFRLKGQYFQGRRDFLFKKISDEFIDQDGLNLLAQTIENKKQSIVFVPTRANFKHLVCKECGEKVDCPYCNVSMSLHSKKRVLRCHYCGYATAPIQSCHNCGSDVLEAKRVGTAEVVKFLQERFPENVIEQFDRDTVTTDGKLKKKLNDFNKGKIDILVGTQMLSKGHNYHSVECAIILGIDYMLMSSDFRAEEKALALLLQIAGRAGRKSEAKVLVYSDNQEFFGNYLNDYERFLDDYKEARKDLYPPYKKLARVLFEGTNEKKCVDSMEEMVGKLFPLRDRVELIGMGECPIGKINNKFRFNIFLRSNSSKDLLNSLYVTKNKDATIDIDPLVFT